MPESLPLLTIAVPTYNRAANLKVLLSALAPELTGFAQTGQVEILISDNCSPDDTAQVVDEFVRGGLRCRYLRNATNVGPDANFLQCYREARGRYFWLFSDDDVLFPGALTRLVHLLGEAEYDLVYMAPAGFLHHPDERGIANPRARARVFRRPAPFLRTVGLFGDVALITAVIVNKQTVERAPHPPFEQGMESNLVQLGWTFTALRHMRRGLVFDRGLYAVCELHPSRPFDVVRVFGTNWHRMADTFLQRGSPVWNAVLSDQLYSWFVTNWFGMRRRGFDRNTPDPAAAMRRAYGARMSYWLFAWPLLAWPMPVAAAWLAGLRGVRAIQRRWVRTRMRAL